MGEACRTTLVRVLASCAFLLSAVNASAQGVAFQTTSLPHQVRQEGITETTGEVALTAISTGTILAGSVIDLVYGAAITNNSTLSTNNISLANNVACTSPTRCPTGATIVGSQTLRLSFSSDKAFSPGDVVNISRVRLNANSAIGLGSVSVSFTATSADPATNPITFSDPSRVVGILSASLSVTPNPGGPATKVLLSCGFPQATPVSIRLTEGFPTALSTLAQEATLSGALAPTNGVVVQVTLSNIPAGITLDAPANAFSNGALQLQPGIGGGSTVSTGADILLTYDVISSTTAGENISIPFTLSLPNGATSMPPVGTPIDIQVTARVTPITSADSVIVRFANNATTPATLARITDCRAKGPQVISE